MTNSNEHELESVFECVTDDTAQIVISFLETNGIHAFENSDMPHSIFPVLSDAQVVVNKADAERARSLLEAFEPPNAIDAEQE